MRSGELVKRDDFFQLVVVDHDVDATGNLWDDNNWTRTWPRGVLIETSHAGDLSRTALTCFTIGE